MKPTAEPSPAPTAKKAPAYLAPCLVAAFVWLSLSLYMHIVVPAQLGLYAQELKPEEWRAVLPPALRLAVAMHEHYGTPLLSLLGLAYCGVAYMRRNEKLANVMILIGALCLGGLVWMVLASLPKVQG